ncbi:MAG: hypothetical protein IJR50_04625 [Treponema sp.]|nr:hypothetical protein [Treponema sp.]
MPDEDIIKLLVRLRGERESKEFEIEKNCFETAWEKSTPEVKDLIRTCFDQLSRKIETYNKQDKEIL